MTKLDDLYGKITAKPSKRMRIDVAEEIEKIMGDARSRIEKLADEYREAVMLPTCRKLGLTYLAGMGRTTFYTVASPQKTFGSADEVTGKYKALMPIFEQLNVEVSHNDVFGFYVADIKEEDL